MTVAAAEDADALNEATLHGGTVLTSKPKAESNVTVTPRNVAEPAAAEGTDYVSVTISAGAISVANPTD